MNTATNFTNVSSYAQLIGDRMLVVDIASDGSHQASLSDADYGDRDPAMMQACA